MLPVRNRRRATRGVHRFVAALARLPDLFAPAKGERAEKPWEGAENGPSAGKHGGEGGIRTPGDPKATPVFKTGPFNRSGTSPRFFSLSARSAIFNRLNRECFAHNK